MKTVVLGTGSWGTALSILLARSSHEVVLFGRQSEELEFMATSRENLRYLPGFRLPENVRVSWDDRDLTESDLWVVATPSGAVRSALGLVKGSRPLICMAAKGIELGDVMLLSDVAKQVIPDCTIGALSGPNLAIEIARGVPTAAVCAYEDKEVATRVRDAFMGRTFRVYTSSDLIGVELAGALKNVMAIAAGMSDALGFGDNTKGALLARGLYEMSSLGMAMGGRLATFMGIAGVGDLFATAVSKFSRNYRVGLALGSGQTLTDALESIGQVAEGIPTSECAMVLSRRLNVPMPAFEAVESVIRGRVEPLKAVDMLMERMPRSEDLIPEQG